ncbi:glycoside hydrolase family 3 N-terminal domain-containing protein [Alicyclobacillus sp. ALC3]|uniref:glycoside hydrolase family 3 N-terminal domain-containing protein n=1 Tax=Alicyclobacillus sp. ALC3 TaxID=2796143 RepID=UPI00237836ED|nr:glycoside hydrolase family 3 N-terminal domain-containing protein [Alicyclobacillus sp. ALC3]WDL95362.1 glycoside hydrolase family 3 C-terminal domain-containing protein [Alicyclobacillus sp. ALC3]
MSELYRDASRPVEERVEHLLSLMTPQEKSTQLGSLWVYEVLEKSTFSRSKAEARMKDGIGQITRIGGASSLDPVDGAEVANEIQRYLVNETRLGIPALVHEESCSGYMAKGATLFPQTIGVASTWNPDLTEKMGEVIRTQMKSVGAHQALAPLLDVTRDARWGRVEETFGEDPYLVTQMGLSYVRGLQTADVRDGVIATGKHFVGYGVSEGGMNWAPPHIPERELRDVFLQPFEAVVRKGKLGSIMPGYHELDGVPCHASTSLLTDVLRKEWGFDGIVVSDYFAVDMLHSYHHLADDKGQAARMALQTGVDVELPSIDCYGAALVELMERGLIDMELVDAAVRRVLTAKFRMGLFEHPYVDESQVALVFDNQEQRALARTIAQQSIVLLKNEGNMLPLQKDVGTIAVIGPNAHSVRHLLGDYAYPCHIETLQDMTNTFNTAVPEKIELDLNFVAMRTVLEAIRDKVSPETRVVFAQGTQTLTGSQAGIDEAVAVAKAADVTILVVGDKAGLIDGCSSGESLDRASLDLPGLQEELVRAVHATGTPVVAVLANGRPLSINWLNDYVPAILEAWLPGEEGAAAIADVLFGDYNPGGRLPMSVPRSVGQVPVYYNHKPSGGRSHWKGDYVEMSAKPLYPFGYGLSYTEFAYSNLVVSDAPAPVDGRVTIQVDVTNTGAVAGEEVVQLYVHDPYASVTRPVKELKGFRRVALAAGETRTVTFVLPISSLGFHNVDLNYVVEPGVFEVMVGSSSEDIRLTSSFEVTGEPTLIKDREYTTEAF